MMGEPESKATPPESSGGSRDSRREHGSHPVTELARLSQQGYQFLRENMLDAAERKFSEILQYEPDNNYALVGMGDSLRKRRELRKAADYYERCLATHPNNNYALFGLADCLKGLKQYHKALEIWERYLKHDDRNVTILTRVADSYRKVRNFDRARELYLRVLEIEEDNPYALIGLGHLHYDFRDYANALYYWKRMYRASGENVDIRVLTALGNCHRKMKAFADGVFYFHQALERDPDNFYALYGMADCYRGMEKQSVSLEYWNRILQNDPHNKVILTRAGDAYRELGQTDKAEAYYQAALNIEYDPYAILGLAIIQRQRGNVEDAIRSLERLVESEPQNARIHAELARCRELAGRADPGRRRNSVLHKRPTDGDDFT